MSQYHAQYCIETLFPATKGGNEAHAVTEIGDEIIPPISIEEILDAAAHRIKPKKAPIG